MLATSHAVNHIYELMIPVVSPAITAEYGLANAGILLWSFVLSYSLLPAVSGYLSRYFGRKKPLVIGFVITSFSLIAAGLVDNFALLIVLFFIAGIGGSMYHPFGSPILAETYSTSTGRTLGLHQTGGALGGFIGPMVTGVLALVFGWRSTIILLAVPGVILAATLWYSINPERDHVQAPQPRKNQSGIADLKKYTPSIIFIIAAFIYILGLRGTDVFAGLYFGTGRGMGIAQASFLFSMLKAAGLFSAPICGELSDRYGRKRVLIILVVIESLSLLAITFSPSIILPLPCLLFGFASFGMLAVGEALLAEITPEKDRPTIFGINLTASFSPKVFLVPVLFGLATTGGFDSGFILLSALMPLSIPFLLSIRTKNSQQ